MPATALPFRHALTTNSTSTGFTAKVPTLTKPSGSGVHDLLSDSNTLHVGRYVPSYLLLMPYAKDGNNDTFDMRLYAWNRTNDADPVWVPQLLIDLSVVVGDIAASATGSPLASGYLADTLTVNDGGADNGLWQRIADTQEDMPATIIVHTRGAELIEFDWDLAGGQEAVSMNCLFRPIDL